MKPIELGCKAIIVRSYYPSNLGKEVTVVTHDPEDEEGFIWEVEADTVLEAGNQLFKGNTMRAWSCTEQLMRIDDYKPEGLEMGIQDKLTIIKLKEATQ